MSKNKTNIAASIRQRLLNQARQQKRPFNELLQYYAMERFLYRLSQSIHNERFVLKGALMLRVWQAPEARPTMDIDMLGRTANQPDAIAAQIAEITHTPVADDGMEYDATQLRTEVITEEADYQGLRIRLEAKLSGARIPLQLDIGFGDALVPDACLEHFPTLLDFPAPYLLCYSRESAIAEKFEAMVKLGGLNSRMKDFYDIWLLARRFDFNAAILGEAIHQTFLHRGTDRPSVLPFEGRFVVDKQSQWNAFHRRLDSPGVPENLAEVCSALAEFLGVFLAPGTISNYYWRAPGPWRHR
ncbi:nucleotidyl transferase AbiEii/AbiGii toxin family protein [Marinimicrobium sp. ABcell2]|uniref:nucleotidyl transferase AbiEii/AbiGii toxin family protein n=1 Tax=Marinimicrobium sp. ABcell2 TaxID=3069751 RepID=UPI0027B5D8A3|nr:nucleotidyl transferase AbiEii/AbiGii toxin family protein [Marinimicrobium sp. ABcell2]MDQ2075869.1 nucleotidyl transferase AbiEii/AbiGii toxin family protein [Marinimicrobium sp. ABcell2]